MVNKTELLPIIFIPDYLQTLFLEKVIDYHKVFIIYKVSFVLVLPGDERPGKRNGAGAYSNKGPDKQV